MRVSFEIPDVEYRALAAIANRKLTTVGVVYRDMGTRLIEHVFGRLDVKPEAMTAAAVVPRPRKPASTKTGRGHALTAEQIATIRTMHEARATQAQIGAAINVHQNTVGNWLRKLGLKAHPTGRRVDFASEAASALLTAMPSPAEALESTFERMRTEEPAEFARLYALGERAEAAERMETAS